MKYLNKSDWMQLNTQVKHTVKLLENAKISSKTKKSKGSNRLTKRLVPFVPSHQSVRRFPKEIMMMTLLYVLIAKNRTIMHPTADLRMQACL
jgi:hypothetical protein